MSAPKCAARPTRSLSSGVRARGPAQIVGQLSGGNQQKVVLGKWLETSPRILIMDEPTRGIDVGAKAEIHALMARLAGEGMAILMISSELPEILGMSDRVLVMHGGRLMATIDRANATAETVGAAMTQRRAGGCRMTVEAAPAFRPHRSALTRFVSAYGQEIVIACAIVVLFAVVSAINPRFLGANNLNTIISGNAYIAVAAIGMAMIIITGHIDVSVGALIGVLANVAGNIAISGAPIWVAWVVPIFVGMGVNFIVGVLVAYGKFPRSS
jgi:rhamnose transport system ATP-binding protein